MPVLFLSLGAELLFIVQQSLVQQVRDAAGPLAGQCWSVAGLGADSSSFFQVRSPKFVLPSSFSLQNVPTAKKSTVLDGMICTMFDESFIAEIFEPQRTFSQTSMMGLFNRIAHSSTMRLNSGSKGAIHDRMNIALKHMVSAWLVSVVRWAVDNGHRMRAARRHTQAILVESPANLANCVLLLLEQLSGICSSPRTRELLASIRYRFLEFAASMTPMDWVSIRQTILRFTHQPAGPRKIDQLFCAVRPGGAPCRAWPQSRGGCWSTDSLIGASDLSSAGGHPGGRWHLLPQTARASTWRARRHLESVRRSGWRDQRGACSVVQSGDQV